MKFINKIKFTFSILSIVILLAGCKRIEFPKPNNCESQLFCNSMTCKVDGVEWEPECTPVLFSCDPVFCQFYRNNGHLEINGASKIPIIGIRLLATNISDKNFGFYTIFSKQAFACPDCDPNNINDLFYDLDTLYLPGKQMEIINVDTIKSIIEGHFNFRAIEATTKDTVYVTDGYFKLSYIL